MGSLYRGSMSLLEIDDDNAKLRSAVISQILNAVTDMMWLSSEQGSFLRKNMGNYNLLNAAQLLRVHNYILMQGDRVIIPMQYAEDGVVLMLIQTPGRTAAGKIDANGSIHA